MLKTLKKYTLVILTLIKHWNCVKGNYVIVKQSQLGVKNTFLDRTFLARSVVKNSVVVEQNSQILDSTLLGNNKIGKNCSIANSSIGTFTYVGYNSAIHNTQIGKYCSIGPEFKSGLGKHPTSFLSTSPIFYSSVNPLNLELNNEVSFNEYEPITIGNDVWIGTGVFISEGISVGDGAVIGAGAVVTKDVPPYAIVGGVPAKVIKYRFSNVIINHLLNIKWWEKDIKWIEKNIKFFNEHLTEDLLKKLY